MSRTYRKSDWPGYLGKEGYRKYLNYVYHNCNLEIYTDEYLDKKVKKDWIKYHSDNKWYESGKNKWFKTLCKRDLRNKNRRICKKAMDDPYYDEANPNRKDGKRFIWSVW